MHTVSLFPHLLDYGQAGPFLVRITLAAVLLHWAYRAFKNSAASKTTKGAGFIEGIAGILFLIGLFTQLAALVAVLDLLIRLWDRIKAKALLTDGVNYYLLLLVLAVSLLVTGAGWWAFDLPL